MEFPNNPHQLSRDIFERLREYEEEYGFEINSQENLNVAIYSAALDESEVYQLLDGDSTFDLDEESLDAFKSMRENVAGKADVHQHIPSITKELNLTWEITGLAHLVIDEFTEIYDGGYIANSNKGGGPEAMAAGAVYICNLIRNRKITQSDVGDVVGKGGHTVGQTHRIIKENYDPEVIHDHSSS
jgi:hypothetical protein